MRSKISLDNVSITLVSLKSIRRLVTRAYLCRKFFFILMNQYNDIAAESMLIDAAVTASDC